MALPDQNMLGRHNTYYGTAGITFLPPNWEELAKIFPYIWSPSWQTTFLRQSVSPISPTIWQSLVDLCLVIYIFAKAVKKQSALGENEDTTLAVCEAKFMKSLENAMDLS